MTDYHVNRSLQSNSQDAGHNRQPNHTYADLQARYDPDWAESERVQRLPQSKSKPKKARAGIVDELIEAPSALDDAFETTYRPARFEEGWLLSSLRPFYDLNLVSDVLAIVKGGKEANVYRCRGGAATQEELVAAKVYRPRQFRNLRNDRMYREGREILAADGRIVKENSSRIMRAIGKKTEFGVQVSHTSWLMYEYTTLRKLHAAGASVPQAFEVADNAVVMSYRGDEQRAAPTLHEVSLPVAQAKRLFDEVVRNLEIMLAANLVHGDLSAYNILYWEGEITLIDFPQVTNAVANSNAHVIFQRDVQRICEYFAVQGVRVNSRALASSLWQRFQTRSANEVQADLSRTLAAYAPEDE